MRKNFLHKCAVYLLAVTALSLAVFTYFEPKIQRYNSAVKDEQIKLKIEANGKSDGEISFSGGFPAESSPGYYAQIGLHIAMFLIPVMTKRIVLTFLFAFIFVIQFRIIYTMLLEAIEFPMSYFYNYQILSPLFAIAVLALSFWTASFICRFCRSLFLTKTLPDS